MIIYKVLDETFVSRCNAFYREKYFIPNGITNGYRRMGSLFARCDNNIWIVKEMGYSDLEINKMPVVGAVKYRELTAAVARELLEHIVKDKHSVASADVAPVRHGHWRRFADCGVTRCSVCDYSVEEYIEFRYCPHCGAKMDEEVNDNAL